MGGVVVLDGDFPLLCPEGAGMSMAYSCTAHAVLFISEATSSRRIAREYFTGREGVSISCHGKNALY